MDKEDMQLKCLANLPIIIHDVNIKPKTLKEVTNFNYSIYNQYLNLFCFNATEVAKMFNNTEISHYQYICVLASSNQYRDFVLNALRYFIDKTVNIQGEVMYYLKGETPIIIDEVIFNEIVYVVQLQNALIKDEENEEVYDPADAKAKAIIEKLKKSREKLNKAKKMNGEEEQTLTLLELISVVACNCNNININNVWELNLFQFNDQFNRMVLLDNHRVNIRALLAGAKQEDMEVENWMKKIH